MHWREVLSAWCRPVPTTAPEGLPAPLAEFVAAGGRGALSNQIGFIEPEARDGWTVFGVEDQGVCQWAYRTRDDAPDPEVFVDYPDETFVPVGCRLDDFLSGAAVEGAALAPWIGLTAEVHPDHLDRVLGAPRFEIPHLGWPHEARMIHHHGSGILSLTTQVHEDSGYLFLAAQATAALVAVEARLEADPRCEITERWDYSQR